jgi:hypothetical protein
MALNARQFRDFYQEPLDPAKIANVADGDSTSILDVATQLSRAVDKFCEVKSNDKGPYDDVLPMVSPGAYVSSMSLPCNPASATVDLQILDQARETISYKYHKVWTCYGFVGSWLRRSLVLILSIRVWMRKK